ncbi:MAG TPA: metallophosphoesterase [Candidatus Ozemobacteraceae bacterium]|nr:metallophosphoesterase [Candidatus Ozemobacteraceae bacterium]
MKRRVRTICLLAAIFVSIICVRVLTASPGSGDLTIAVISDLNESYGSTTYSEHVDTALRFIEKRPPDLVLCAGDMVAGQKKSLSEETLVAMWSGFNRLVRQRLNTAKIPFAFAFGNHDGPGTPAFAHERRIAEAFWLKRKPPLNFVDDSRFPRHYSFTCGAVFFAVIDVAHPVLDDRQRLWLEQQLRLESARSARVRVILGHVPLYAIAEGRNKTGEVMSDADRVHALFRRLGVDYYISGHHHAFYLSEKDGLKMISCGALGGGPRKLLGSDLPPRKTLTFLTLLPQEHHFRIETYEVTDQPKLIDSSSLPDELHGFNGSSRRLVLPRQGQ